MRCQGPPTSRSKVSGPESPSAWVSMPQRLRALNDRLIHCSISGFGRSEPLKNSPGYDVILQAFSESVDDGDETAAISAAPYLRSIR